VFLLPLYSWREMSGPLADVPAPALADSLYVFEHEDDHAMVAAVEDLVFFDVVAANPCGRKLRVADHVATSTSTMSVRTLKCSSNGDGGVALVDSASCVEVLELLRWCDAATWQQVMQSCLEWQRSASRSVYTCMDGVPQAVGSLMPSVDVVRPDIH